MEKRHIIGIGETVLDIVLKDSQPLAAVPGGSTFNAMISLGRTASKLIPGVTVSMVTQMGNDEVASIVSDFMLKNGLDTAYVDKVEGIQSCVSLALLDQVNNAHYEFFRDASAPAFHAPEIVFHKGDIVVFGSFFAINPETRDEVRSLVRSAHDSGAIVYYDINFRKSRLADLALLKGEIEENCRLSDVVRGSSEDIECLWGTQDASFVYDKYMSKLCSTFICTKGSKSTEVFSKLSRCEFPVTKIQTVSTIGAGDNFNAGFVFGLLRHDINPSQGLTAQDWEKLVPTANRFSANVCQSIYNYVDVDFADTL